MATNSKGWKYSNKDNCCVEPKKITVYPWLPPGMSATKTKSKSTFKRGKEINHNNILLKTPNNKAIVK